MQFVLEQVQLLQWVLFLFHFFADFSLSNFDIRETPYSLYPIITKLVILKRSNLHIHDMLNIDFYKFEQKLMVRYRPRVSFACHDHKRGIVHCKSLYIFTRSLLVAVVGFERGFHRE